MASDSSSATETASVKLSDSVMSTEEETTSSLKSTLPPNVRVIKSRAIESLFSAIRDRNTNNERFVECADRLCAVLSEECLGLLSEMKGNQREIDTPCGKWTGLSMIDTTKLCGISIIRSGDILLESLRMRSVGMAVGKILMQRDESTADKRAKHYYTKLPKTIADGFEFVVLCDPMLATGGSASGALNILIRDYHVPPSKIVFLNIISCPEGLKRIYESFPEVTVVTAAVDPILNEDKFIVPGLGDFGDRYYRTQ